MDREEFMRELEDMFQDEPDNNKLNVVLDLADAYVEYEYEERKKSEKVQWGKDVCAAAGEDTDEFPEQVFVSISEKLENRMLENNGDLEYAVVQEVVNEFWEREEGKDADKRRTGEERAGKKVEGNKRDFEGKCHQKEGIYCRNYLWKNPGS